MRNRKPRRTRSRDVVGSVGAALVVAAVVKELRTPPGERTWHGELLGFVPYDLRRPTWDRFRRSWWAPESPRVLLPRAFGVGWSVNLARVRELAVGQATASSAEPEEYG